MVWEYIPHHRFFLGFFSILITIYRNKCSFINNLFQACRQLMYVVLHYKMWQTFAYMTSKPVVQTCGVQIWIYFPNLPANLQLLTADHKVEIVQCRCLIRSLENWTIRFYIECKLYAWNRARTYVHMMHDTKTYLYFRGENFNQRPFTV